VADPQETRSCHLCVTTPNLVALGQTVWVRTYVRSQNKFGDARALPPWDGDMVTPYKHASPHISEHDNFSHSGSYYMSLINGDPPKKFDPLHPTIHGHSVIGTHMDRSATYDCLLVIISNHGPISYHYQDKWRFLSKIINFSHTHVFNALTEGIL